MKGLAYYITAHGFGHGVRSCDILNAFHQQCPQVPIWIVSDLPPPFLRNRLAGIPYTQRRAVLDVGMVQRDSVRVDVEATLDQALALCQKWPQRCAEETRFLRDADIGGIVCDIPAIPLEAAAALDLPRLATGNFSWSWIYSAFVERDPRWQTVIDRFTAGYQHADLLLRMPFAEPMSLFADQVEIPVLAEPGHAQRQAMAKLTGADPAKRWVLLSFSTLDWDDRALARVAALHDYAFFTVRPLAWEGPNFYAIDREDLLFSDVMASVDAVITKPGFGVLSECVVNRKPILYVDRADFLEYPVLEAAIQRYLQHLHIPAAQFYRGELEPLLSQLWDQPTPREQPPMNGAPIAAERIATHLQFTP